MKKRNIQLNETLDCYNDKFFNMKSKGCFVFDKSKIKLTEFNGSSREYQVMIVPMHIYENKDKLKFLLIVNDGTMNKKSYISDKNGMINFTINKYYLMCKCAFISGEFNSYIFMREETKRDKTKLDIETEKFRCIDKNQVGYGTLCYEYNGSIIRVIPYDDKNNESGNALTCVVVQKNDEYKVYPEIGDNNFSIKVDEKEKQIINYWKDDILISEII